MRSLSQIRPELATGQALTDNKAELTELGKNYAQAKENAVFDMRFGPDPAWVRTGKLSIHEARDMVRELAKWVRRMECLQEEEVAKLVTKGLPNKTIAVVLDISPWTVATHLRRIYAKLGVNSRTEMVACILKQSIGRIRQPKNRPF